MATPGREVSGGMDAGAVIGTGEKWEWDVSRKRIATESNDDAAVVVSIDLSNEQAVIRAAITDRDARRRLLLAIPVELFGGEKNRAAWELLARMEEDGAEWDEGAPYAYGAEPALAEYVLELAASGPVQARNIRAHVERMRWDASRRKAAERSADFTRALRNPKSKPEDVRVAARAIVEAFDGTGEARYVRPGEQVAAEQAVEIRMRIAGRAEYPFGMGALDRVLSPGAAPGMVTVVSGTSGSGKSTLALRMALGLADQGRRVLYGAWEPGNGNTLEAMASMKLGLPRRLTRDNCTEQDIANHKEVMHELARVVKFMDNPFRPWKTSECQSKDRWHKDDSNTRIDTMAMLIEQSGCEVFFADLLRRAFTDFRPDQEELALYRMQDVISSLGVHGVFLQQQTMKEVEQRKDKRPTRDSVKGTSGWVEIADHLLLPYREALWKNVPDDRFEVIVGKQRHSNKWPALVVYGYDPVTGVFDDGNQVAYDFGDPMSDGEPTSLDDFMRKPKRDGGKVRAVARGERGTSVLEVD